MYCCPSPTIWPHDGVGGLIPTPMNDSAASVKIASGIPNVTATTIGVSAFGRMWRTSRRWNPAPSARAPSTNSFSLIASTCARVWRAIATELVGAQRVVAGGRFVEPAEVRLRVRERRQEIGEDRDQAEQRDHYAAGHRETIAAEPAYPVPPETRGPDPRLLDRNGDGDRGAAHLSTGSSGRGRHRGGRRRDS